MIILDPKYQPRGTITSRTELGPGIQLSRFAGASHIPFSIVENPLAVARHCYLHANILSMVKNHAEFNTVRLVVTEGIYVPAPFETVTPGSFNDKRRLGRGIGYQVINRHGEVDFDKSFDMAEYIKDYARFESLTLAYDTFDPSGDLSVSLLLTLPDVSNTWNVRYDRTLTTTLNQFEVAINELVELKRL